MLDVATLILFPILMAYAAFSDLFTMTISNYVSICLVMVFLGLALALDLPMSEIGWHFSCGLAILALTFTFFAMGWIGGGDAKLAAATALWLGWDHLADFGLIAALLGGALAILILQIRKWPLPAWFSTSQWIARIHDRDNGVPYGIALAIAGLLIYPETSIWLHAAH
jgi:prepilin peptidase CpaA